MSQIPYSRDYRLVKVNTILPGNTLWPEFSIREVWYNEDGNIETYSPEPATAQSDTVELVEDELKYMLTAFQKPILEEVEFEAGIIELVETEIVRRKPKKA